MKVDENDFEKAILGAILLSEEALEELISELKPEYFSDSRNMEICRAVIDLYKQRVNVDLLTVTREIAKAGRLEEVGGSFYVASLTDRIASSANIMYHFRIMQQDFLTRELVTISNHTRVLCNEPGTDPFETIEGVRKKLDYLENNLVVQKTFDTIADRGMPILMELEDRKADKTILPCRKLGLTKFDEHFGFYKTDLVIIAARPGMGKTALLLKGARQTAIVEKRPCGIFSLEMSTDQLFKRLLSAECEIDSELIRDATLSDQDINAMHKKVKELTGTRLLVDDTPNLDIEKLCFRARKMVRDHKVEEIFIDYIGLISTTEYRNQRTNQIGYISRRLKQLAKELNIPIIALAQLSRSAEKNEEKRLPILSDLRDSGDIEQDADQVYFIFRPQYYGMNTFNIGGQDIDVKGKAFIVCAKNRHGKLMTEIFKFVGKYTDFRDDYTTIKQADDGQTDLAF